MATRYKRCNESYAYPQANIIINQKLHTIKIVMIVVWVLEDTLLYFILFLITYSHYNGKDNTFPEKMQLLKDINNG